MTVIRTLSKLRDQRRERRLLAQGTLHVLGQRKRLRRLRAAGLDTREAERMLEPFEDSQLAMSAASVRHRERKA